MDGIELRSHGVIAEPELALLRSQLAPLTMLQDVVRWGFAQSPPTDVADVIVQDEFTHDVVIPWKASYLVFDTT